MDYTGLDYTRTFFPLVACHGRDVHDREFKQPESTRFALMADERAVSVFIILYITAQSGPVILVILCHSYRSSQEIMCVCMYGYLLNCT